MRGWIRKEAFKAPRLGFTPRWQEIALTSLSINLLSLAVPLLTLQVYDRIIVNPHGGTLNVLCFGVAVAIFIEAILRLCRSYGMAWSGAVFEHTLACNAVRQSLGQEIGPMEDKGIGEHLQRIGAVGKIRDFFSGQVLATLVDLPFILVFLGLIAFFAGNLVTVPLVLLGVAGVQSWYYGRKLKSTLKKRNEADEQRYAFLVSTLSGIHTLKSLGLEALLQRRYEKAQQVCTEANFAALSQSTRAYDHGIAASGLMMVMVAVFGAPMILQGTITTGTLVACILLSGRIMQPVQKAMALWTRVQDVELACQQINEHFAHPAIVEDEVPEGIENNGRLEMHDVSFTKAGQVPVLENINLKLKRGDAIAISGDDTAATQTLLKLMAGMYPPSTGEIAVNGAVPHTLPSRELINHIGYLAPAGTTFSGTIYDNLSRFGHVPEARVMEMAELLGIDEEVAILPAGYETRLDGGNADLIFPGLRQRISIARVLAGKPRIILFDHADQALDKEGYNRVFRLLGRLKGLATLVVASNDQNIRDIADWEYTLEAGRLVGVDITHEKESRRIQSYQELQI